MQNDLISNQLLYSLPLEVLTVVVGALVGGKSLGIYHKGLWPTGHHSPPALLHVLLCKHVVQVRSPSRY